MAVRSKKPSDVIVRIATYFFTALFAVLCVLPMWHVIMASFSDPIRLSLYEGFLFSPLTFSVEGYELLFSYDGLWAELPQHRHLHGGARRGWGSCSICSRRMCSRARRCSSNRPLMVFIIITMLFSGGIIPLYIVVRALGAHQHDGFDDHPRLLQCDEHHHAQNGMESVNDSICEAAQIDGAGHVRILVQIMLPLTTSFIATVVLFNAIGHWNSWVKRLDVSEPFAQGSLSAAAHHARYPHQQQRGGRALPSGIPSPSTSLPFGW